MNKVGVIGWPIEHSLSPAMHNAAFAALGMTDWWYDKYAIPPDIVRHSLKEFRSHEFIGLNVTVPHKQAVMPYVKSDAVAKAIGAVNTIDFRRNTGTNTDAQGFMDDLAAHEIAVAGKRVLVLGAGGAARAAVYGLAQAGADIVLVNRTPDRAQHLLAELKAPGQAVTIGEAAGMSFDVLVNATSVGMSPDVDASPWPDDLPFPHGIPVYDMVYRPAQTKLMAQAERAGCQAVNGAGMLVRQGAAAFALWTGVQPPVDVMMQAVLGALSGQSRG
jgi:shikimate dehydrogenase